MPSVWLACAFCAWNDGPIGRSFWLRVCGAVMTSSASADLFDLLLHSGRPQLKVLRELLGSVPCAAVLQFAERQLLHKPTTVSKWQKLADVVLNQVLAFCDCKTVAATSASCRRFRAAATDGWKWRVLENCSLVPAQRSLTPPRNSECDVKRH